MKWVEQDADPARPLAEAERLQRAAATQGFDWPELAPLWDKLHEEIVELQAAIAQGESTAIADELGDLLFMLVNFSRFLDTDAGAALHGTNQKFIARLRHVEQGLAERGASWEDASLEQLEALWQAAKGPPQTSLL